VLAEETVAGPAAPGRLAEMHAGLGHFWMAVEAAGRSPSAAWRAQLETAVMEIVGNVLRHAYPPAHRGGNVKLRLRLYRDRVEALVTDRGVPFEEPAATEPLAVLDPLDLPEHGYGLAVARAAVDQVEYSRRARGSNHWRLVKRLGG
jgi:serine/threonine-protein kinase RsbW